MGYKPSYEQKVFLRSSGMIGNGLLLSGRLLSSLCLAINLCGVLCVAGCPRKLGPELWGSRPGEASPP